MLRLFHFTDEEAASAILSKGFRAGERGGPWFAPDLNVWGERARSVLLEIQLDATEEEMKQFKREDKTDAVLDSETDQWIPITDPAEVEILVAYAIPAEIVNSKGTVRRVPADERKRLWLYGIDWEDEE